jgi:hypothetical protein
MHPVFEYAKTVTSSYYDLTEISKAFMTLALDKFFETKANNLD